MAVKTDEELLEVFGRWADGRILEKEAKSAARQATDAAAVIKSSNKSTPNSTMKLRKQTADS
jgi:hypothetical protein